MMIVLSHVVNSAIEGPRFNRTKQFGGSFNGSLAHLKWFGKAQVGSILEPLKEPPNNLVPINLAPSMAEFTTCERTIFHYFIGFFIIYQPEI
jgi:hypothetical protein